VPSPPSFSPLLAGGGAAPGFPEGRVAMRLRTVVAAILAAAPLPACFISARDSGSPRFTVSAGDGKVYRVNNRTGEVWVYEGSAWKSLGGGGRDEGGGVHVNLKGDDDDDSR
jgi:hypothetical protein